MTIIYLTILSSLLIPLFLLLLFRTRTSSHNLLPPGSLGLPFIGQSLGLLRAMRTNTAEEWLRRRIGKYGPISKLTLFGKPTVFVGGPGANKLIFGGDGAISNQQNESLRAILGERNLIELAGEDHKRVRSALVSFLKPECLKQYVGKMDEEIRRHIQIHWQGKQEVTVLPLMKILTFDIVCSLLFGLERGKRRERMIDCFRVMIRGVWSIPINLPFTRYNQSRRASKRLQEMLKNLLDEKRVELEEKSVASPHQDLITCLLSIRNEENELVLTEKEIVHNSILVMVAGFDTSSVLITFMMRILANNPTVYAAVLQEQEEIARSKKSGELLSWEDLGKMKYTWRVALETLRLVSPIFGGFRKAMKDIEFGGYIIPKGWQIFWASPTTHLDETIFKEPSKFDPNRFDNQASVPPYCFVGFGGGPRICPGNEFARVETLVTIHYLITKFTWKLLLDDHFTRDPMPVPTKGLPLKIWPRETSITL